MFDLAFGDKSQFNLLALVAILGSSVIVGAAVINQTVNDSDGNNTLVLPDDIVNDIIEDIIYESFELVINESEEIIADTETVEEGLSDVTGSVVGEESDNRTVEVNETEQVIINDTETNQTSGLINDTKVSDLNIVLTDSDSETAEMYVDLGVGYAGNELMSSPEDDSSIKRGASWEDIDLGNGRHNLVLYSGIRFVYEDDKWKKIEEARSLKGWFNVIYLEKDERYNLETIDFNYTSIKFATSTISSELNKDIPLKIVYVENDTKKYESILRFSSLSEKIYIFRLENVLAYKYTLGNASTTVQLQDPDTENLDDTSVVEGSPNYAPGARTTLDISINSSGNYEGLWDTEAIKINATKLVVYRSTDVTNHTKVNVTIEDCLNAATVTAKAWSGTTPATLEKTGDSSACNAGQPIMLNLSYEVDTSSTVWVGIESDDNITLSVDNDIGLAERKWYYDAGSGWTVYDDVGFKLYVPFFNGDQYALIKFNLSQLPSNASIIDGSLVVYTYKFSTLNVSVYDVTGSWTEESATWNNRPAASNTPVDSKMFTGDPSFNFSIFNVTSMINTSEKNISFYLLKSNNGSSSESYGFVYSKEYAPSKRPCLNITYISPDQNKFVIKNNTGDNVAWFGDLGNIVLKGILEQNSNYQRNVDDAFVIRNNDGDVLIIAQNGSMYIDGTLFENQETLNSLDTSNDFRIAHEGDLVSYVNESGYLFLKGSLVENGNP